MKFTKASVVAAFAVAAIAVGTPERADAQQPSRPDTVARPTPAPVPVRKDPAPTPTPTPAPTPTPSPTPTPTDSAARTDSLQAREAAGDVAMTAERLVVIVDSADVRATALGTANVSNVELVSVADLATEESFTQAVARNEAALGRLRTALAANQAIAQALAAATPAVNATQVVGIELHDGGHAVVYYRPMP